MSTEKETHVKGTEMTCVEKARYLVKNITVEPMLACYIVPCVLAQLATQNLNLEKACRVNLHYSDELCSALASRQTENYTKEETEVQQLVANMSIWRSMVQSSIPAFLIMFLGSWSDRVRRRKPFMLIPIVGEFIATVGLILCVFFFYELPMEVSGFVDSFFPSITGGWTTMFMAIFSYMGDITTIESRTLRIGIVNVFCTVGVPLGTALSGILYKAIGFYGVFSMSASFYMISFTYGFIRIKELRSKRSLSISQSKNQVDSSFINGCNKLSFQEEHKPIVIFSLRNFFDLRNIKETFSVVFKAGPNNRKKRVILLMIVLMVVIGPVHGEMTVMYLFMRYKFNWDEVQYSMFSTYSVITHLLGTAFSVGVFSHWLKIDDALIGVMSSMSKILAGFVYAFAQTEWQIYIAPLVDIVNGTSFIAMRSIASKLVPPEELGKLNSLYGACEALTPLVYGPMYAFVYARTMDVLPGAFMLLGGALTLPAVAIFGWMYTQHKKEEMLSSQHLSRKPSLAGDILKSLQVEPIAVTTTVLDPPGDKAVQGIDNPVYVEEKFNETQVVD